MISPIGEKNNATRRRSDIECMVIMNKFYKKNQKLISYYVNTQCN